MHYAKCPQFCSGLNGIVPVSVGQCTINIYNELLLTAVIQIQWKLFLLFSTW